MENLLYCCPRCNQYKADYWPSGPAQPQLWNPRQTPASAQFIGSDDGTLHPLTALATFSLWRLRLNRSPLVALRRRRRLQAEEARLLAQYRDLAVVLEHLNRQQAALLEEQRRLLEEQRSLLGQLLSGG